MKKEYMVPKIEIVNIVPIQIIAASPLNDKLDLNLHDECIDDDYEIL